MVRYGHWSKSQNPEVNCRPLFFFFTEVFISCLCTFCPCSRACLVLEDQTKVLDLALKRVVSNYVSSRNGTWIFRRNIKSS